MSDLPKQRFTEGTVVRSTSSTNGKLPKHNKFVILKLEPVTLNIKSVPGYLVEEVGGQGRRYHMPDEWAELFEESRLCACDTQRVLMVTGCRCEAGQRDLARERGNS